ncbi:hypothetical protein L3i23_29930 (plasmid) [Herbiconiux sp. L3-i23]|nr:hypothetical protein L3i23_29930 [Herbiconiux sp. L3-i23]
MLAELGEREGFRALVHDSHAERYQECNDQPSSSIALHQVPLTVMMRCAVTEQWSGRGGSDAGRARTGRESLVVERDRELTGQGVGERRLVVLDRDRINLTIH